MKYDAFFEDEMLAFNSHSISENTKFIKNFGSSSQEKRTEITECNANGAQGSLAMDEDSPPGFEALPTAPADDAEPPAEPGEGLMPGKEYKKWLQSRSEEWASSEDRKEKWKETCTAKFKKVPMSNHMSLHIRGILLELVEFPLSSSHQL